MVTLNPVKFTYNASKLAANNIPLASLITGKVVGDDGDTGLDE